jgi:hypothetical protein
VKSLVCDANYIMPALPDNLQLWFMEEYGMDGAQHHTLLHFLETLAAQLRVDTPLHAALFGIDSDPSVARPGAKNLKANSSMEVQELYRRMLAFCESVATSGERVPG